MTLSGPCRWFCHASGLLLSPDCFVELSYYISVQRRCRTLLVGTCRDLLPPLLHVGRLLDKSSCCTSAETSSVRRTQKIGVEAKMSSLSLISSVYPLATILSLTVLPFSA